MVLLLELVPEHHELWYVCVWGGGNHGVGHAVQRVETCNLTGSAHAGVVARFVAGASAIDGWMDGWMDGRTDRRTDTGPKALGQFAIRTLAVRLTAIGEGVHRNLHAGRGDGG